MTVSIDWYSGTTFLPIGTSGLGFYGDGGFAASVPVGSFQGRTFVTDSAGVLQGWECNNVKYLSSPSGILGQTGTGIALTAMPNLQASLQPRFISSTAVKTQNVRFQTYDRSSISNNPSGVTVRVAELVHPGVSQTNNGSGSTTWSSPLGTSYMQLTASPGLSGFRPSGASTTDTSHFWHLAISVSPDSIGSKLFAGYLSLEYL